MRTITTGGRPLAVWLLVTAALTGGWTMVGASVQTLRAPSAWQGTFEDLLVACAAAALMACLGWLWVVTTVTVAGLISGRACAAHGLTRRLVLMACGVAVVVGVSSPALAGSGSIDSTLAGLPLPDRAVASAPKVSTTTRAPAPAPATSAPAPAASGDRITIHPGDSLWSIARAELGPTAGIGEIDTRWRALYAANRREIGPNPDLVRPGQHLRPISLPTSDQRDSDR